MAFLIIGVVILAGVAVVSHVHLSKSNDQHDSQRARHYE